MRLTDFELMSIKQTFLDIFKDGDIYLFGSRVDDSLKDETRIIEQEAISKGIKL